MTNLKLEKIEIFYDEMIMGKVVHLYIRDTYLKPKMEKIGYFGTSETKDVVFDYEKVDDCKHICVPISDEYLYNYGNDYATIIKRSLETGNILSAPQIERLYTILLNMQAENNLLATVKPSPPLGFNGGYYNFEPKSQRDPGVDKLPGLYEIVKHPANPQFNPAGGDNKGYGTLVSVIIDLNDREKWTVNQIADWLDSIHDPTGQNGPNLRLGQQEGKIEEDSSSIDCGVGQLSFDDYKQMFMHKNVLTVKQAKKLLKGE